MKICIISDTHLSAQKYTKNDKKLDINRYLVRQFESLDWVLEYLKEQDIDTIIHAGDMFDSPRAGVYCIKRTREAFDGFDVYAIKGNHDDTSFLHDNEISALDLLNINSFNTPEKVCIDGVNFCFTPWGYEIDETMLDESKKNVLVAHGFPRSYFGDGEISTKDTNDGGILSNKTKLFDLVITGHAHSIDEFRSDNTRYLNPGSLSASSNDSGESPSIWILDTSDLSYTRVKIPVAIQLIRSKPEDVNVYLDSIKEENIYRITVDSKDNIDRKSLLKAKRAALDVQIKLIKTCDSGQTHIKKVDDFWEYVSKNSSYEEDFKKAIQSLDSE